MKSDLFTYHLIYPVKENEPTEEVVLAMQGIIYRQNLPPFDKEISYVERSLSCFNHKILLSFYHFM